MEKRVIDFWTKINTQQVPYLIDKFRNRRYFGNEEPDEAIIYKLSELFYNENEKLLSERERKFLTKYNQYSDLNLKYGLPEKAKSFLELRKYLKKFNEIREEVIKILPESIIYKYQDFLKEILPRIEELTDRNILTYNGFSDINVDYGLPEKVEDSADLNSYQDKIEEIIEKINISYSVQQFINNLNGIGDIFSFEYAGTGIDFSVNYTKEYLHEIIQNPEKNKFRQKAEHEIVIMQKFDNLKYYICLPETYDLVLGSSELKNIDYRLIKYGLYLAYLDEQELRSKTTRDSRHIFTVHEVMNIIQAFEGKTRRILMDNLLAYPIIPPRANRLRVNSKKIKFYSSIISENIPYLDNIYQENDYKGVRYNINGSALVFALNPRLSDKESDIDIRLDLVDSDEYLDDSLFDEAVKHFIRGSGFVDLKKIFLKGGEKYKYQAFDRNRNKKVDFYRGNFGAISNYHVPAVRINYDKKKGLLFYPSAIIAWTTGVCVDLRFFATENSDPMKVVEKYMERGFTFFLNINEVSLFIEYKTKKEKDLYPSYIPKILDIPGYKDYIHQLLELKNLFKYEDIDDIDEKYRENFRKHLMFDTHNKMMTEGKSFLRATMENLPVPKF